MSTFNWHKRAEMNRDKKISDRIADGITGFAGTMKFVYIHVFIFILWCATGLFGIDKFPYNFLTLSVSLEAIFLATFVMISQNRQSQRDKVQADADYQTNLDSEQRIKELQQKLAQLETEKLDKIITLIQGITDDFSTYPFGK